MFKWINMKYIVFFLLIFTTCDNQEDSNIKNSIPKPESTDNVVCQLQPDQKTIICPSTINGKDGEPGPKGDKGESGKDGIDGQNGEQGLIGPTGPKGDKGERGDIGPKGEQGLQGIPGPKGDTGDSGTIITITKTDVSTTGCIIILTGYSAYKNSKDWDIYGSEDCSEPYLGIVKNGQIMWLNDTILLTIFDSYIRIIEFE